MMNLPRAACAALAMLLVVSAPAMADDPPPGTPGFVAGDDSFQADKGSTLLVLASVHGVLDNDAIGASPCMLAHCGVAVEDYPTHGTLSISDFGGFTYVPDPAFSGTDSFTYRATSAPSAYSNRATVTITVTESPETPGFVAHDDTYDVQEGKGKEFAGFVTGPLSNDVVNGVPCTARLCAFVLKSPPSHGSVFPNYPNPGGFSYRPAPGFVGTDTLTYRVADPSSPARSNAATITINVHGVPSASPDAYTTVEGVKLSVSSADGVLHNDLGATGLNLLTEVSHGALDLDTTTGAFTYEPASGFVGSDSFTYSAKNSDGVSAPVTVTITVTPAPPVATGDSYELDEDGSLTVDAPGVLGNDVGATSAHLVTDVEHGTLVLDADGSFSYVPNEGFDGVDQFTYVASFEPSRSLFLHGAEGQVAAAAVESMPATVTLTVTAAVDPVDPVGETPTDKDEALPDTGGPVRIANLAWALLAMLAGVALVAGSRRRGV